MSFTKEQIQKAASILENIEGFKERRKKFSYLPVCFETHGDPEGKQTWYSDHPDVRAAIVADIDRRIAEHEAKLAALGIDLALQSEPESQA